jgi:Flp pilus assembly protein TadG
MSPARFVRDRSGAGAVEFALIMPVFATLLFAAMVFGQAYYAIGSVQWAIERTARDMMVSGALSEAEFEQRLRARTENMSAMTYQVSYSDTLYGEIRVTEITTVLSYPVTIPFYGELVLTYPVAVHAPRPFSAA